MRNFTKAFLMLLLCTLSVLTTQAKTEKVHATFENPSNTNTTWNAETKTFTWSTTYYNQLRNIGLPNGDVTKYKKLVVDCTIKSGDQFRILIYKGGSNLTLYAKDGVNEFILADTLKALYPNDYNEYLLACDEICLSGNNAVAPGEAVINDMYLETYDDEGEKVYATFESPSNTNTTWNSETKTFTWSTTYYNQLRNIGLPSGDITKYKKLVVDCEIKSGDQFRVLIYKGGSNLTLYAKNGVNEFILADTLKALSPNDYNEYLLACDEICLSGNNAAAPGEAVINAVYLETYPENESVEIPEIQYEEDPGKPEGDFVDFIEVFSTLQPRIGLGEDTHPIVLGNGDVVVGQRTKDIIADLSAYSKLTMVTSPNLKLVVYMNHEVDAQQNAGDYAPADSGKYVFLNVQADENGIAEVDLTQYTKQDLNCICLPWDNNNKGTVWYLLLTKKADTPAAEDVLPIDIQFGANYNNAETNQYTTTWTSTKDGKTWTLVNFSNNNNAWDYVRCGRKNNASVASITSPAINAVVKSYVISLTKASNVNSAKLFVMNGEEKVDSADITAKFVAGDVIVPVESQKGYSYDLIIDNKSASSNGSVEISKITLAGETIEPVEPVHIANTADSAYTVAKAIELIDAGEALSDTVFVKGIVSKVDEYSEQYKNITYWISDDGTTESAQFECFRGKNINGADFAAIEDVEVGAEVIVKGTLKKYNDTYELNQGNELVSYKAPFKPLFADGKYYIYNVGAQKYLAAGANWGTHAVVNATGLDYEIKAADGKYTLDSQVSNGGDSHFLNGEWNDGAAFGWTLTQVAEGKFTISNGEKFLTAGENGVVTLADDATAEAAQWSVKTLEARIAELATATAEAPIDATFLIQDADFGRNDLRKSAWTMEASNQSLSGGNNTNNNAESYHAVFTLSQTLTNAPAGKYQMTAQGFYRQDDEKTEALPVFYANDKTAEFPAKTGEENSMSMASESFTAGLYTIEPIEVTVFEDGQLTIGAKGTATSQWVIFDNFRLTYLGNAIDLTEIIAGYNKALEDAKAALAAEENAIVTGEERTALTAAIAANENVAQNQDSLTAAVTALNNATSAFTGAKGAYNALATAKAEKAAMTFAYAAADKKAAAEATLTAEATSAADATAKVEAITKAYRVYAESSALLEGVEGAQNMTDAILNPQAENEVNNWTTVLGEGSGGSIGIRDNEPWTDGADNATHKYFDGGNWGAQAWDVTLEQKIALPKGKYQLTVKSRAAGDVAFTLFAGNDSTAMPAIGASNGLFNGGWNDASVEFELTEADSIAIGVRGVTTKQYNWMSFSDFRLMQFPAEVEITHTWDFTQWSDATVANLKAEAAKVTVEADPDKEGNTLCTDNDAVWSDHEKKPGTTCDTYAASKDNCFWYFGGKAEPKANGEAIAEFAGLQFDTTYAASRALAIAVNYPKTGIGTYNGPAYLWFGGKNQTILTIKNVKAGTQIKMGVESHKSAEARGVQLFAGETELKDADGNAVAAPKTYTEQTWVVPGEEGVVDIVVKNTNGCHIYFIDAEIGEPVVPEDPELEVAEGWHSVIENGNLATDNVANFFIKENGGDPMPAVIVAGAGKNGSRGIVINTPDNPSTDWDAQLFIQANENIPAGYKIHVEFDYMATQEADFDTQSHAEPGNYIHWYCIDSYTAKTEWQHMSKEVEVSAATQDGNGNWNGEWGKACDASEGGKPFKTIGFNLSKVKTATVFHFDNITFWVTDVATGIVNVKNEKNNDVIYNLNGLKVNKAQKGLYIINGKKVVIK